MPDEGEWLTVQEAAKLVQYHPERVRELIREGKIEARKFASVWAVRRNSLLQYVQNIYQRGEKRGPKPS
jgi:excisionase family DNA binding protein